MNLTDKITTFEEALSVPEIANQRASRYDEQYWYAPGSHPRLVWSAAPLTVPAVVRDSLPKHMWWLIREWCRFQASRDVYGTVIAALWAVPSLAQYAPKPSSERGKIDFFPDSRAGEAERPITTTVGRFLNKVSPLYSDEFIKRLDEAYRAEMSNEIELLSGAENFRLVYLEGPSSCMSKYFHSPESVPEGEARDHYEKFEGNHPVDAYDVPGVMIAVGRDSNGRVNARCVVYVNPDNPEDKRMVRVYGDASLAARLRRNGFKLNSLSGVNLRRIPLPQLDRDGLEGVHAYCAPYLDGPGGLHTSPEAGRNLIHVVGRDYLTAIETRRVDALRRHLNTVFDSRSASSSHTIDTPDANGVVYLRSVSEADVTLTCPLTERAVNLVDEDATLSDVYVQGRVVQAIVDVTDLPAAYVFDPASVSMVSVRYYEGTPTFDSGQYIDTPDTRRDLGYIRLRDGMYVDYSDRWVLPRAGWVQAIDGFAYRMADVMRIVGVNDDGHYDPGVERQFVAREGFNSKDYIRLHNKTRTGGATYTTKNAKVVKTDTGRTVLPGYHEVRLCGDGKWRFERGLVTVSWLGNTTVWMTREQARDWNGHLVDDHPVRKQWVDLLVKHVLQNDEALAAYCTDPLGEPGPGGFVESREANWIEALWVAFQRRTTRFSIRRPAGGQLILDRYRSRYDPAQPLVEIAPLMDEYIAGDYLHSRDVRELKSVWEQVVPAYTAAYNQKWFDDYGTWPPSMVPAQVELVPEPPVELPGPAFPPVTDMADVADAFAQADRLVA